MHAFNVYIDEAGDEGFQFRQGAEGSSEWFILSAAITRTDGDLEAVKLIDRVREQLNRPKGAVLHFQRLKHEHRLPLLDAIGHARIRSVSIMIYKPALDADLYSSKGVLYRYATRLLLERVSWLCRDSRVDHQHRAKLIFSNRANMSYDDLCAYLKDIERRADALDVRIDWSAVDCTEVDTKHHNQLRGLQVADAIASGMYSAVRLNRHGFAEPRYAELLRPTAYAHQGRRFGYGVKVMPAELVRADPPLRGTEWLRNGGWGI